MIVLGFLIAGLGLFAAMPPSATQQFDLPMVHVGGGVAPEVAVIEPLSELKYRNIVKQAYDYSCGSAALVTLLNNYLGISVTEQQAMEGMLAHGERDKIIARRGFSLLDMKRYVLSLGAGAAGFRGDINDLAQLEAPVIVPIDYAGYKHFVVLRGIRDGKAFLADPSAGHIVLAVEEFAEHWDGNTLFMVYAPEGGSTISRLALADRELGVFDQDRVRQDSDLSISTTDMLNRSLQTGLGTYSLRK